MPVSISLGIWLTLLTYLISIPLGIRKAVMDGTRFDTWTSAVIIVGFAIPGFLFAILLIILFAGGSFFNVFPLRGLTSDGWAQFPWYWKIIDYFWHFTLPLIAMGFGAFATMTFLTKNSFLDEIRKQYVMTARAKGCSEHQVLYNHIFRNAMLIVIAGFPGAFIHAFFSGSLLIETIFSLDGLGLLSFESVLNRDYPVVFGTLFIFSLVGLVVNLISDLDLHVDRSADRFRGAGGLMTIVAPPPIETTRSRHSAKPCRHARPLRAVSTQSPALAEFQVEPPRLLVVLDLPDPVLGVAVRRVDRQRSPVPHQVSMATSIGLPFVSYSETTFGGDFETAADYRDPYLQKLITDKGGSIVWPLIRYSYDTHNLDLPTPAPSKPTWMLTEAQCKEVVEKKGLKSCRDLEYNWLGTDDQGRDVVARLIYGFRISVLFGLSLTIISSVVGVAAGGVQGYFGGWIDLGFQRFIEMWTAIPSLYLLLILSSVLVPGFFVLLGILLLFSWVSLVGLVRAEFLRGRNFEYIRPRVPLVSQIQ